MKLSRLTKLFVIVVVGCLLFFRSISIESFIEFFSSLKLLTSYQVISLVLPVVFSIIGFYIFQKKRTYFTIFIIVSMIIEFLVLLFAFPVILLFLIFTIFGMSPL